KVDDTERRAREILAEAEQRGKAYEQQLQRRNEQLDHEVRDLEARRLRVVRTLQELQATIGEAIRQPVRPGGDQPPPVPTPAPGPEAPLPPDAAAARPVPEPEMDQVLDVRQSRPRRRLAR